MQGEMVGLFLIIISSASLRPHAAPHVYYTQSTVCHWLIRLRLRAFKFHSAAGSDLFTSADSLLCEELAKCAAALRCIHRRRSDPRDAGLCGRQIRLS